MGDRKGCETQYHRQSIQPGEERLMRDEVACPALSQLDGSIDTSYVDHEGGKSNACKEEFDSAEMSRRVELMRCGELVGLLRVVSDGSVGISAEGRVCCGTVINGGRRKLVSAETDRPGSTDNNADDKVDREGDKDGHGPQLEQDTREHWRQSVRHVGRD